MLSAKPENIRIDDAIGDGVQFTLEVDGVTHRFFISRQLLGDLERTLLPSHHDMLASFTRQSDKIRHAVAQTLRLGCSSGITFLKMGFFE